MVTGQHFGDFDVWLRLEAMKSVAPTHTDADGRIWVKGIATTPKRDYEGQDVDLDGLDWDYAVENKAWFDSDHDPSPEGGRGRLTKVKPKVRYTDVDGKQKVGAYVEGYLYPTEENRRLKELLEAMDRVGDAEGIGLSIRGPIKALAGPNKETIAKAVVRSIAITRQPVNNETRLGLLSKSLATANKALDAGAPMPGTGGGTGAPLLRQDLQGGSVRNRRGKMKKSPKEFLALHGAAVEDEAKALTVAKALGYDPDKEYDDDEGGMSKAMKDADEMLKALGPISEHLSRNGVVDLLPADARQAVDAEPALRALTDAHGELCKGLKAGTDAIGALGELVKSLSGELAEVKAQHAEVVKALGVPALPKGVREGGEVVRPEGDLGDIVDRRVAEAELVKAFGAANKAGDKVRASELATLKTQVSSGRVVRKAELAQWTGAAQ